MNISELCIRRPIMTLLLTISLTLFGVQVFRQLPVNDLPAVDYPVIQVSVSYPGASPETMANTVATPLEKQFLQIPGLDLVTSTNQTGQSTLVLQFSPVPEPAAALPVGLLGLAAGWLFRRDWRERFKRCLRSQRNETYFLRK